MVSPYSVARIFITENGEFVEIFWISQRVLSMVSPYSVARIFITENGEFVEIFWISQRVLWVLWLKTPIILCSKTR
jgi:hypothetical protein